jgi:hypothetical protein
VYTRFPSASLYDVLGLVCLPKRTGRLPWAKARTFSESRMRENRLSGSISGMGKRSMVWLVRHRRTKEPETDRPNLTQRVTSRLHKQVRPQNRHLLKVSADSGGKPTGVPERR